MPIPAIVLATALLAAAVPPEDTQASASPSSNGDKTTAATAALIEAALIGERPESNYLRDDSNTQTRIATKGGAASAVATDLLTTVAEVAVRRAKRNGLSFLKDRLTRAVCHATITVEPPKDTQPSVIKISLAPQSTFSFKVHTTLSTQEANPLLPTTCSQLQNNTLEKLAGDPESFTSAILTDFTGPFSQILIELILPPQETSGASQLASYRDTTRALLDLARTLTLRAAKTKSMAVDPIAARAILDELILDFLETRSHWSDKSDAEQATFDQKVAVVAIAGIAYVVTHLATDDSGSDAIPSAHTVLKTIYDCSPKNVQICHESAKILTIGIRAMTATKGSSEPDGQARARATVEVVFAIARQVSSDLEEKKRIDNLEALLLAAMDRDLPTTLASAGRLLEDIINKSSCEDAEGPLKIKDGCRARTKYDARDLLTLLSSIASYGSTYLKTDKNSSASPDELRAARTAALEAAIDTFTVRTNRHGSRVVSLGLPVGFTAGLQWRRSDDGTPSDASDKQKCKTTPPCEWTYPQLSLPLGIALQRLPGHRHRNGRAERKTLDRFYFDGAHVMLTALDLGQFVAYDENGSVTKPRWNTFLSLGGQIGWLIGTPANSFVVAADVRYAPTLFPVDSGPNMGTGGGTLRVGLSLAYYVSLFDFN